MNKPRYRIGDVVFYNQFCILADTEVITTIEAVILTGREYKYRLSGETFLFPEKVLDPPPPFYQEETVQEAALSLIQKIYSDLPEFNSDDEVDGSNLVDYMEHLWERITAIALAKEP